MEVNISSNGSNGTDAFYESSFNDNTENICIAILVTCCLVAMCVNILVFVSVFWIRNPMTPILRMSLSLAAADACSSAMFAIVLYCSYPIINLIRMICIVITVAHLLALSLNHYIGILKPLHYNSIVTHRKVSGVIAFLWIFPTVVVVCFQTIEGGFNVWSDIFQNETFEETFRYRMSISSLFFIPIILMAFCYAHILIIVRRQQKIWRGLSRTSTRRGRNTTTFNNNNRAHNEQRQLEGNLRAIYTTLLILGSCIVGWMPALLFYTLMCRTGCIFEGSYLDYLNENYAYQIMSLRLLENILIVMKMFVNPIIYSIRMKEIQDGSRKMYFALAGIFCPSKRNNSNYRMAYQRSPLQRSFGSMQMRIASFRENGNSSHVSIGRTEVVTNTFL